MSEPRSSRRGWIAGSTSALRVSLPYVALASLWILASDYLLGELLGQPRELAVLHVAKGLAFVAVTGLLLHLVLSREVARQRGLEGERRRIASQQRAILDTLPAHIALLDRSGRILAVNRAWRRFAVQNRLGAADAGVGLDYLRACDTTRGGHEEQAKLAAGGIREVLAGARPQFEMEYACDDPGGTPRWFHLLVRPVEPSCDQVVVMHVDVTSRRLAQATLEEEARAQAALARVGRELIAAFNTPRLLEGLCRTSAEVLGAASCRTYLWNAPEGAFDPVASSTASAEELDALRGFRLERSDLGPILERLEGTTTLQVDIPDAPETRARSLAEHFRVRSVLIMVLRQGEELIGFHSAAYDEPQPPLGAGRRRIADGIAQLASMALQNFRLFEELERANRLKSDFVATISHELRTPLNVILGYSTLLHEGAFGELPADQADTVTRILRNARQLAALIGDTLDLSRLETGRVGLAPSTFSVPDLLAEIVRESEDVRCGRPVVVGHQVAADLPPVVSDRAKLKIVLRNLIGNALKFTEHGSVTATARGAGGGITIEVADTGMGIPADALPIIFEPFRQGDSSMTRRHGGVGLGLYVVRRLLERLGGKVEVESELGRGSTFRVWIPQHPPEQRHFSY